MSLRIGKAAWDHGKTFVGQQKYQGLCKAFVREECFNVDPSQSGTAKEAWYEVPSSAKHYTTNPEAVPAYVWVFMNTSASAEHAVMSGPLNANGKRLCLSVDAGPNRSIAVVGLGALASMWGPVVGWGEILDGQRIWDSSISAVPGTSFKPVAPAEPTVRSLFESITSDANRIIYSSLKDGIADAHTHAAYQIRQISHNHDGSK